MVFLSNYASCQAVKMSTPVSVSTLDLTALTRALHHFLIGLLKNIIVLDKMTNMYPI